VSTPSVARPWCDHRIATPAPRSRKVTSVDVARRAGVSQTTVSLVLSGKSSGRVSAATAEAVRRAARQLGYQPNTAARALRSGAAAAVGMVVSDVTHPFFGRTLRGAQRAAWEAGHVVVLIDDAYGAAWGDESVEALRAGTIDGFLFFAAEVPASLRRPGAPPVVLVESEGGRLPHVRLDVDAAADQALGHLHELGHRRIASVRSAIPGQTFDRRHARWAAHLRTHGQDPDDAVVVHSHFEASSAIAAGHELLAQRRRFTAVLCDDDILAGGVLAAAAELGVDVPGEVSVVGFDDIDLARLVTPPLTTVRLDAEALGAAAFETLHARLQGRRPRNQVLPTELVVRASSGPPRRTSRV
jgi:DNA-binding LacI/PurR family transcriptional regulator